MSSSEVERRVEGARVGGSIPSLCTISGAIAQKGERLPCKQDVVGSIPSGSTTLRERCREEYSRRAISVRAAGC
jgi:hypothetical protein